jgi:hypothetical protein
MKKERTGRVGSHGTFPMCRDSARARSSWTFRRLVHDNCFRMWEPVTGEILAASRYRGGILMQRTLGLVVFVLAVGVVTVTRGQVSQDSIDIGAVSLQLGMAEDVVLHQLGLTFDLQEPASGSWIITEKGHPIAAVGSVSFKAGKLTAVYKNWTVNGRTPNTEAAFADALFGAVGSFEREGRTGCTVETGHSQDPTAENKVVLITCGRKYLQVDIWRIGPREQTATISEVLR